MAGQRITRPYPAVAASIYIRVLNGVTDGAGNAIYGCMVAEVARLEHGPPLAVNFL